MENLPVYLLSETSHPLLFPHSHHIVLLYLRHLVVFSYPFISVTFVVFLIRCISVFLFLNAPFYLYKLLCNLEIWCGPWSQRGASAAVFIVTAELSQFALIQSGSKPFWLETLSCAAAHRHSLYMSVSFKQKRFSFSVSLQCFIGQGEVMASCGSKEDAQVGSHCLCCSSYSQSEPFDGSFETVIFSSFKDLHF